MEILHTAYDWAASQPTFVQVAIGIVLTAVASVMLGIVSMILFALFSE